MTENLDLFDTDPHIPDIVREQHLFQTTIQETRERVEMALSKEEREVLRELVMSLSPLRLAQIQNNLILIALLWVR